MMRDRIFRRSASQLCYLWSNQGPSCLSHTNLAFNLKLLPRWMVCEYNPELSISRGLPYLGAYNSYS